LTANTIHWCICWISAVIAGGAEQYPTFQPVVWYALPNELMTTARCAMSG
jgi:hypothetical protein